MAQNAACFLKTYRLPIPMLPYDPNFSLSPGFPRFMPQLYVQFRSLQLTKLQNWARPQ